MPPGRAPRMPNAVDHGASTTRAVGANQHDRVLAGVKARRYAPPPLRGADGLDTGCAHGHRQILPVNGRRKLTNS